MTEKQLDQELSVEHADKANDADYYGFIQQIKTGRQYMEKTVDYGYAVTNTKAQGSTYPNTIVDLESIEGKNDYWFGKDADDALRNEYVAISRSSGVAHLITRDKFTNSEQVEEQDKAGCKSSLGK